MTRNGRPANGGHITIAAGGSGGHLFPALALAQELTRRSRRVDLITDDRGRKFAVKFPGAQIFTIPAGTVSLRRPLRSLREAGSIVTGLMRANTILAATRPGVVVGFGGYPSVPPLLAAVLRRLPTCIHEQNGVMGRANRLLARFAKAIAISIPATQGIPARSRLNVTMTGNPTRARVLAAARTAYPALAGKPFHILVFGGSQGARIFSDVVPAAIAELPAVSRKGLRIVQQVREEDRARVAGAYEKAGIGVEVETFFEDLPERIAASHLVISRAGASTVSELGVIARPAILVPLPHAIDNDQLINARAFASSGGGWVVEQSEFTPDRLAALITRLRFAPQELEEAAQRAGSFARGDAVQRLADMVESLAARRGGGQ